MRRYLIFLIGLMATPLTAAPFTVVETGAGYPTLIAAVVAIGEGKGTIRIAPGVYRDCAVQLGGTIRYVAAVPRKAIFDGGICESKAALVLRGRGAVVDGIVFRNMRVPDGNGAGIRIEAGSLAVANSVFRDSEQGIQGNDDPRADIRVDRSTFSGLGRCDRGLSCAHSIYIGGYRSLTVRRSRFERGRGGHYVKSRAAKIDLRDCSFDDTRGQATNYMVDLTGGADGRIVRNVFVQGANKENHGALIAVGAEGVQHSSAGLVIAANHAEQVRGVDWPTVLVADWTGTVERIEHNILSKRIETRMAAGQAASIFSVAGLKARLGPYYKRWREQQQQP